MSQMQAAQCAQALLVWGKAGPIIWQGSHILLEQKCIAMTKGAGIVMEKGCR